MNHVSRDVMFILMQCMDTYDIVSLARTHRFAYTAAQSPVAFKNALDMATDGRSRLAIPVNTDIQSLVDGKTRGFNVTYVRCDSIVDATDRVFPSVRILKIQNVPTTLTAVQLACMFPRTTIMCTFEMFDFSLFRYLRNLRVSTDGDDTFWDAVNTLKYLRVLTIVSQKSILLHRILTVRVTDLRLYQNHITHRDIGYIAAMPCLEQLSVHMYSLECIALLEALQCVASLQRITLHHSSEFKHSEHINVLHVAAWMHARGGEVIVVENAREPTFSGVWLAKGLLLQGVSDTMTWRMRAMQRAMFASVGWL